MALGELTRVVRRLRGVLGRQHAAGTVDGDLLKRFIHHRDEAAFEALLHRHGPMVLGVCRRVLHNPHDAEDAFQATFMVLARKAPGVRSPATLGNWLYGVAFRTALAARRAAAHRRSREARAARPEAAPDERGRELWHVLDQELERLPEKYRSVVVLCDLEGQTRTQVSRFLGLAEGTVASRLQRARARLAKRLTRLGFAGAGTALAAAVTKQASSACVPTSLTGLTLKASTLFAAKSTAALGTVTPQVAALTKGALQAMFMTQLKLAAIVLVVGGLAGAGVTVATQALAVEENGPALTGLSSAQAPDKEKSEGERGAAPAGRNAVPAAADVNEVPTPKDGPAGKQDLNARGAKVQELLKERLAALKEIATMTERAMKDRGTATPQDVLRANKQVHEAELELCRDHKERLAVHEKIVAIARDIEKMMTKNHDAGRITKVDLLKARASRLEAEIALERARLQGTSPRARVVGW